MVLQRILHGERLDELLGTDEAQSILKAVDRKGSTIRTSIRVTMRQIMIELIRVT